MKDPFRFCDQSTREAVDQVLAVVLFESCGPWPEPTPLASCGLIGGGQFYINSTVLVVEALENSSSDGAVTYDGGPSIFTGRPEDLFLRRVVKGAGVKLPRVSPKLLKNIKHVIMVKKGMRLRFNKEIEKFMNVKAGSNI